MIEGLQFREALQAVGVTGGVATNVIPDSATVGLNHRFAPDRTVEQAQDYVREIFAGWDVAFTDWAAGARPGFALTSENTASICAVMNSAGTSWMPKTPLVFCAVSAVITDAP